VAAQRDLQFVAVISPVKGVSRLLVDSKRVSKVILFESITPFRISRRSVRVAKSP